MNTFVRWGKFNLVGAAGMAVQLTALALLDRWMPGHYLYAAAAAIEITLLHNFLWHSLYTWRDCRESGARGRRFVRFHLSNGLVSMIGNLGLMRLLAGKARLALLVSNVVAIIFCSFANFWLGNTWAFAPPGDARNPNLLEVNTIVPGSGAAPAKDGTYMTPDPVYGPAPRP